jgi:competence protein CoiA
LLVALLQGQRIEARAAQKGDEFCCPGCKGIVILKKGRIVIPHFAHKPPTDCTWAKGETRQHLESKTILAESFRSRGLKAEVEFQVETLSGDRRADVMTWGPKGQPVAIELQHTSIGLDDLERRAFSYAKAEVAQIWVPFIRPKVWADAVRHGASGYKVEKYSAKPFEIWIHDAPHYQGMWMYDPRDQEFWKASLGDCHLWKEESSYFNEYGDEEYYPGGWYKSKRWKELILEGPFKPSDLRLVIRKPVKGHYSRPNHWPAGRFVDFQPA